MSNRRTLSIFIVLVGLALPVSGTLYAQSSQSQDGSYLPDFQPPRGGPSTTPKRAEGEERARSERAAKDAEDGGVARSSTLGVLVLDVSPRARVATVGEFKNGLFSLGLWRHDTEIAPQVVRSTLPVIVTFNSVPLGAGGVRLDIRLDPKVKGVAVVRSSSDTVELHFSGQTFAGAKVRMMTRRDAMLADIIENQRSDVRLAELLAIQLTEPPGWIEWGPITWPIGLGSPLRPSLRLDPEPHPFGRVPKAVRRGWNESPILARAVELANQGRIIEASQAVAGLPVSDDLSKAMLALARGYIWSQPDGVGEPIAPGRAAQSYSLAAGLVPEAGWVSWARGQAAYNYSRAMKFHNAIYQYEKAIALDPTSESRPLWDVGAGLAMVEAGREEEGVARLVNTIGGLPKASDGLRFTGRKAVAHVLWKSGEVARAARVLDLILSESPALAKNPRHDERWGRILLDAGRASEAYPYLERVEETSLVKVERERARWWLHECGLAQRDGVRARRWLRELIQKTPASTLGPMAKVRLLVLDSVESGGEKVPELRYQHVAMALRNRALEWPNSPVEDEAISLAAQMFFALDMMEDGLQLYHWVNQRSPSEGGALAFNKIICEKAPIAFDDLRARGHSLRAVGIFRTFLDTPAGRTCVDSEMRAAAAATAETAGLPGLATRWLGQAVATGGTTADDALNLIELARLYLREGNIRSAEKTLRYIEATNTTIPPGLAEEVWGDIHLANKEPEKALESYNKALEGVQRSTRHRARAPKIRYQRGVALRTQQEHRKSVPDLREGLENGGAPRGPEGWIRLIESTLATAKKPEDYKRVLEFCDQAEKGELNETSHRAMRWHRSQALQMLGRNSEADQILQDLSGGSDAWAIMAVEAQLDSRFSSEINRLLSLPKPSELMVEELPEVKLSEALEAASQNAGQQEGEGSASPAGEDGTAPAASPEGPTASASLPAAAPDGEGISPSATN